MSLFLEVDIFSSTITYLTYGPLWVKEYRIYNHGQFIQYIHTQYEKITIKTPSYLGTLFAFKIYKLILEE